LPFFDTFYLIQKRSAVILTTIHFFANVVLNLDFSFRNFLVKIKKWESSYTPADYLINDVKLVSKRKEVVPFVPVEEKRNKWKGGYFVGFKEGIILKASAYNPTA
jgi:hypothetical protein